MMCLLLASAIFCIALWIYLRWLKVKHYWSRKGVRFLWPNPIMGNLIFFLRYDMNTWLRNVYDRSNTPYIEIWLFWRPALVVNCPLIASRVLIKDAASFRNKLITSSSSDPIGKYNLFTVKDPLWSLLRRRLSLLFTASKLRSMYGLIEMITNELLQRIDMDMNKNQCVNLRMAFTDYTTDVIGAASLGFGGEATLTGHSLLRNVTKEFMRFSIVRSMNWIIMFFCPELVDHLNISAFPRSSIKLLSEVYRSVLAERGGYGKQIAVPRDLLDALIKIKQECTVDNEEMTEETLIAQAAAFVQGGFDSIANILMWCIYELSFNLEIQENLYKEMLEVKQKIEGADEFQMLHNSKYLSAVLDDNVQCSMYTHTSFFNTEALQKYAPMGWMDRVATQDYKIDDQLTVPAGMPVYINAIGIHYDPVIYPEPTKFKPQRHLIMNENKKPIWAFGDGPRICIGRRFALMNLRFAVARMVLKYEFRPAPSSTPDPSEVKFDAKSLFATASVPLLIEFTRREF